MLNNLQVKAIVCAIFFLAAQSGFSQEGHSWNIGMWHNYTARLAGKTLNLSLYFFNNYEVKGYYYEDCQKKVLLIGKFNHKQLLLTEFYDNKVRGYISVEEPYDSITTHGLWYDSAKINKLTFELTTESMTGGLYESRYGVVENTDDEVEEFVRAIINAITTDDKGWIADHVSYPFVQYDKGKKLRTFKTAKEFRDSYNLIISQSLRDELKDFCPYNLFCNSHGIMLDNGKIWINNDVNHPNSKQNNKLYIIAIN